MMKKTLTLLAAGAVAFTLLGMTGCSEETKEKWKEAGHAASEATKQTYAEAKEGTKQIAEKVQAGAKEMVEKGKEMMHKAENEQGTAEQPAGQ